MQILGKQVKKKHDDDQPIVTEGIRKEYFRDMKDLLQEEECTDCVFYVVSNDRPGIDDEDDDDDDDEDGADDEEEVEYIPIRAHKAVITAQSDYFKALFRKNSFLEAKECIVRVDPAYSVRHVEAVLSFLYTTSTALLVPMNVNDLLVLLQLADQWLLSNLKEKIEDSLKEHIAIHTVPQLYVLAGTKRLRSACLDFILRNLKKLADDTEMQKLIAQDPELFLPVLKAAAELVVIPNNNAAKRQRTGRHPMETPSSVAWGQPMATII